MKYEMQVWVSVSAENERDACNIIELKIKQRAGWHGNDVTYIDAEALKAEPECLDCDALLPEGSADYSLCPACAQAEAADAVDPVLPQGQEDATRDASSENTDRVAAKGTV